MVGSGRRRAFATIVMVVGAAFLVSSCAASGYGEPAASVQSSGTMTFALSDGATGGGPISVNLQRSSDSSGADYNGTMTTGPGFEGPQGQFQISLIGAVETGCGLCNPFDPFPTESTFGYLDSFTLTSPSGLQYTGSAEATGFDDPGMCPLHASDIAWGSKVLLHGHVVGDPSLTAEIEVLTCSPLRFSPV